MRNTIFVLAIASAAALFTTAPLSLHSIGLSVDQAQARIGRPLTPVSFAGAARRSARWGYGGGWHGGGGGGGYGFHRHYGGYGGYGPGYGYGPRPFFGLFGAPLRRAAWRGAALGGGYGLRRAAWAGGYRRPWGGGLGWRRPWGWGLGAAALGTAAYATGAYAQPYYAQAAYSGGCGGFAMQQPYYADTSNLRFGNAGACNCGY